MPEPLSLADEPLDAVLRRQAADAPDRPALVMAGMRDGTIVETSLTVGKWSRDSALAAAYLESVGIGPGDRVAIWGQNSLAWAVWLGAVAWRGAALVALHPGLSADELKAALDRARPAWLLLDEFARGTSLRDVARTVTAMRCDGSAGQGPLQGLRGVTTMPGGDGLVDYRGLLDDGADIPAPAAHPSDLLCMLFTSGSSGAPKLVGLSHRALMSNARRTATAADIRRGDRIASPLPLYHAAGVSSGLILSLVTESLWCSCHRFQPEPVVAQIKAHRCEVVQGVPTMFKALIATAAAVGRPDSLRLGFIGGAAVPLPLCHEAVAGLGLQSMVAIYGQTEFGPTISSTSPQDAAPRLAGDVGHPIGGTRLRIVSPATGEDTAEGEIWVRGDTMMEGYFEDEAASRAAVTPDGWLRTGDLGTIQDGRLRVVGRLKSLIIRGGENVSPQEVEDVLREAADVADACVVPVPSAHWGEEICACVVPAAGKTVDLGEVKRWCDARLSRFKRPDVYLQWPDFPLLASGKVDRGQVQKAAARGVGS